MIFVKIAVPKQAGEFSRVIELADPNRDVRVKISISGNAIAPVIWKSLTNRVSKEGLSKFELQGRVTPEFMERYPGASLSFEFNSPILQDVEVLNPDSGLQTVYLTANTSRIDFNEHVVSGIARVGCQFSI